MKYFTVIALLILTFLVSNSTSAQETQLGIRAGLNFASLSGDDANGLESRQGFQLGVVYNYIFSDRIGIEAGLLYSTKGAEASNDSNSFNLGYMDYPILLKYYVVKGLNIHAGCYLSMLVKVEDGFGEEPSEAIQIGDFGLAFGAEYKLDFGLALMLRYINGVSTIGQENIDYIGITEITTEPQLKNNVLQLGATYYF